MSIVTITTALQGMLFILNEGELAREIPVGKNVKAPVVLSGSLSAQDVRQPDGSYAPGAFGRLPIEAAAHDGRYVIAVAGGLRGTLFKMSDEERSAAKARLEKARGKQVNDGDVPYYNGDLEVGAGKKVWLIGFVREVGAGKERPQGQKFISLQTGDERADRADKGASSSAPQAQNRAAESLPL